MIVRRHLCSLIRLAALSVTLWVVTGCTSTPTPGQPTPVSTSPEFNTRDPIELLIIGKQAYHSDQYDLSERALLESIKLSPTVIDAHLYLGNLYFLTDRYALGREQYSYALKLDPSNLIARNNIMLIDLRQAEHSLSDLEATLKQHNKPFDHVGDLISSIQLFLEPNPTATAQPTQEMSHQQPDRANKATSESHTASQEDGQ